MIGEESDSPMSHSQKLSYFPSVEARPILDLCNLQLPEACSIEQLSISAADVQAGLAAINILESLAKTVSHSLDKSLRKLWPVFDMIASSTRFIHHLISFSFSLLIMEIKSHIVVCLKHIIRHGSHQTRGTCCAGEE